MTTKKNNNSFDLLRNVPDIHNTEELKMWLRPMYIVDDYIHDKDVYNTFLKKIINIMRSVICIKECREYPVKFKFYKEDKKSYTLELRHFYINMILWYPMIELKDVRPLNESFILDCSKDIQNISEYINEKIVLTLRDYNVKGEKINYAISEVLYHLRNISIDFSIILGLNFSLATFMDAYDNNPEIAEIMETTVDNNLQPHEIEAKLHALEEREIELYKAMPNNPIGVLLRANTGVKHKQFGEFTIADGLFPTLEGETIQEPIENSLLIKGFNRPSYLYIAAIGARKSLVMNKKVMGRAGFFGKIVLMNTRLLSMSMTTSDCGSKHLVEYEIKSKKHLEKLQWKYYKLSVDDPDYKILTKKDKDLIGKKIYARSALTCTLGDCVCPKCIGYTASSNLDIADGVSGFESEEITKVINQSILSAKHLLTTDSEVIEFNPEFFNFFSIVGGEINPVVNDNRNIEDIDDWSIYIDKADVIKMEEQDYDSLYNTCIANGRFYVVNNTTGEKIKMQAEGEKEIFLTEETIELMKKNKSMIPFKDIDDDTKLFEMVIMNKELTKPLYDMMNLINKKSDDPINESIDSVSQKFLDLLVESKIDANIVAAELILNPLLRSVKNEYERPDFTQEVIEPYKFITVTHSLENNKSGLMGISCQNVKRQFLSDELYEERYAPSYLDALYETNVSTDNLKKYKKLAKELNGDF